MSITPQIKHEIADALKELAKKFETDELLSKKDLCGRVLNMDINTAEAHIINRRGFPYVMVGTLKRYPKKAVEQWIKENTQYINY